MMCVCACIACMFIVKSKITAMTLTLKLCHPTSGPAGSAFFLMHAHLCVACLSRNVQEWMYMMVHVYKMRMHVLVGVCVCVCVGP